MRRIFHEAGLQAKFREAGYVQVPMLSTEEVAHILSRLPTLHPDDNYTPTGRNGFEHKYHCSFLDASTEYKRRAFDLIGSVFATHVDRYLNGYRILSCNFYVKPPGTGEFVIHQNWPTIADLNDTTVTIWCPLADVVASNGALQFVVGSHKILPHVEGPVSPAYFSSFRRELIQKYLTPNPMNAGEAMIFDDGLIHWSANNDSDKARVAIQIACIPAEVQPVFFFFNPQQPDRFELVEADQEFYLASDVFDLTQRQPHWKSLGFVENQNRLIDEKEFVSLIARGPEIRQQVYSSTEPAPRPFSAATADGLKQPLLPEMGYTIKPFLDVSEIEALKLLYAETTPAVPTDFYHSVLGANVETKHRIFEGIAAIVKDKLSRVTPGYRLLFASFVTKKAGRTRGRLGIHQDNSFVNQDESIGINIWVPLSDVDRSNACLRIIAYSQRFGHISATPTNPSPYNTVFSELESRYLRDLPMEAGSACVFDSRVLHATEENQTGRDRIALYLNLVPENVTPLLYAWHQEKPESLEVYKIDTEFLLNLPPGQPLDELLRARGIFAGSIGYAPAKWSLTDLEERLPIPSPSGTAATAVASCPAPAARAGFWSSTRSSLAGMFIRGRRA